MVPSPIVKVSSFYKLTLHMTIVQSLKFQFSECCSTSKPIESAANLSQLYLYLKQFFSLISFQISTKHLIINLTFIFSSLITAHILYFADTWYMKCLLENDISINNLNCVLVVECGMPNITNAAYTIPAVRTYQTTFQYSCGPGTRPFNGTAVCNSEGQWELTECEGKLKLYHFCLLENGMK